MPCAARAALTSAKLARASRSKTNFSSPVCTVKSGEGNSASYLQYLPRCTALVNSKGAHAPQRPILRRLHTETHASPAQASGTASLNWKPGADIRMLYDGDCPLCMREVNMLRRRDSGQGKIDFVDISTPEYDAQTNADISYEQAMGEIHAILPDGAIVKNIDVFRRLYEAVGLGWVYAITKIGPIGKAADWVYGIWAKYRLPVTGRPDLQTVLSEKKSCKIR